MLHNASDVLHNASDVLHNASDVLRNACNTLHNAYFRLHSGNYRSHDAGIGLLSAPGLSADRTPADSSASLRSSPAKQSAQIYRFTLVQNPGSQRVPF